jgi:hypothetical protein
MEIQAEYSSAGRRPDYLRDGRRERKGAAATWSEAISAATMIELHW